MSLDIARLEEAPHLIDLLIQMEDVLDSLDIYVFDNWMSGIIVAGPIVRRYWLQMTLEYPYDRKPDERGALRLVKHGLQCSMSKGQKGERRTAQGAAPATAPSLSQLAAPLGQDQAGAVAEANDIEDTNAIWLVELKIPRRLITDRNAGQLDFYDEEVDADDVQDASDAGMTDETGYVDPNAEDPSAAPPADPNQNDMAGAPAGAPPQGPSAPPKQ